MAKREFCQLAYKYEPHKYGIGGWFVSEKLDGMRALWDGGVSRGMPKSEVPWANTSKDGRYVTPPISTGLWTRLGNVIHAPDWWLDRLPSIPMDGELYIGRNTRQLLMSIVKDLNPGPEWNIVNYFIFDLLPVERWLEDGEIKTTNFKKKLEGCQAWWVKHCEGIEYCQHPQTVYQSTVKLMNQYIKGDTAIVHKQEQLPFQTTEAEKRVAELLEKVSAQGGEGLIVRSNSAQYYCERSHMIQKVKKLEDDEGVVIGYVTGRETELGSKLLGLMGAIILDYKGKRLELSGFTESERVLMAVPNHKSWKPEYTLSGPAARTWAAEHPGEECPDWIINPQFPPESKITFQYRGKSVDGIPQEARYWRKYEC